jgi:hypothetical protein
VGAFLADTVKPWIVLRLLVPVIHSLSARNWTYAASGAALTASSVAKSVAVSTPLRIDSLIVAVICAPPLDE